MRHCDSLVGGGVEGELLTVVGMLSRSDASWAGRAVEVRTGLLESMVSISEISEGFSPP